VANNADRLLLTVDLAGTFILGLAAPRLPSYFEMKELSV
jgi:hypothetical protein